MKYGMRNRPSSTLCLRVGKLGPSKGREPQTRTYSTTPRLCQQKTAQHVSDSSRSNGFKSPQPLRNCEMQILRNFKLTHISR